MSQMSNIILVNNFNDMQNIIFVVPYVVTKLFPIRIASNFKYRIEGVKS